MDIFKKTTPGSFTSSLNALFQHISLAETLPYRLFDTEHHIFINESSIGCLWIMEPLIGFDACNHNTLIALFQHTLPPGSSLQCLLIAHPHVHTFMEQWKNARSQEPYTTLAQKRILHLLSQRSLAIRSFYVCLSLSMPSHHTHKTLIATATRIESSFKSMNALFTKGTPNDLIQTIRHTATFSYHTPCLLQWNPHELIHTQCFPKGYTLSIKENELVASWHKQQTTAFLYTAQTFPSQWSCSAMTHLIGSLENTTLTIDTPFFISYGVHIPDERTLQSRLLTKCAQIEKQAHSPLARWIPSLAKEAQEWSFVRSQCEQGQRIVRTRLQVGIWGHSADIVNHEAILLTLFRQHGFNLHKDSFIMLPSLLSCLPMTWGSGLAQDNKTLHATKTTLSQEPAALLPLQGDWKGTPSPSLLLTSRRGQVLSWCPFDNNTGNYNVCIIGRSGSGKSVFMQEIALTRLGQNGRVIVIDVGRSFEKLGLLLNAQYIEFSQTSQTCINPFSSINQGMEDLLSLVKPVLCTMASPSNSLTDIETALIDKALITTWRKHLQHTTITLITQTLRTFQNPIAFALADKLFPYTQDGSYGKYFHGNGPTFDTNPFIIIEMEDLKERKDLQSVLVQMIISSISSSLYCGNRQTKTHIILDEAWDLLRGGSSALFIETAARRLRKYQGSLVVGTQSPHDFFQSPGAQAAFDNSDWICFLSQRANSLHMLKKSGKLSLSDAMERMIQSLKTIQGYYAEILIYGPHGYTLNRLLLDPFSQMLFTTKAEEFTFIQSLLKQGVSLTNALHQAMEKFL